MNTLSLYSRESYNPLYGNGQEGYENNAVDGCRLRAAGCHTGGRGRVDAHALPYLQGFNLRGKVTSDTRISFRMSDIRRGLLNRMLVDGYANLHGLQIENVGDVDRIAAGNMTVKFLGKARSATPKAVRGSLFDFDAVADRFSVLAAGCKAVASSVSLSTTVSDPGTLTATNLPNDVPFNINLRAATLSIGDPDDTIRVNLGDAEVSSVISARMLENMQADLYDVRIKGASLSYSGQGTSLGVSGVDARLRAERSGSIPPAARTGRTSTPPKSRATSCPACASTQRTFCAITSTYCSTAQPKLTRPNKNL